MPGIALKPEDKIKIAVALEELCVDSIEAGYPAVSKGEFLAVRAIAKEIKNSEVIALARAVKSDIDKAIESDVKAVHVFIATSDIHMQYKLKMSREQVLNAAVEAVEYAKEHGFTVEFSAEDATRSDINFLIDVFQNVVNAGADRLDIADTVGVMWPSKIAAIVKTVKENVKGNYLLSVHCHDDFGMAVANSVAAIEAGADQAHGTITGVGERAGNATLEEIAAAVTFLLGYKTRINFDKVFEVANLVTKLFGLSIPPNKAIVGKNAFAHEAGIHVHGVISNPLTYEPIDPSLVGMNRRIVIGKHSGRHSIEYVMKSIGLTPTREVVDKVLSKVKEIGDQGKSLDWDTVVSIIKSVSSQN